MALITLVVFLNSPNIYNEMKTLLRDPAIQAQASHKTRHDCSLFPVLSNPHTRPTNRLAGEWSRARDDVLLERRVVNVDSDARVVSLISTRERNSLRASTTRATGDLDLSALHVQLGTTRLARGVESNDFRAQEVLAVRNAGGDRDVLVSVCGDEVVNGPGAVVVHTVFPDLEPAVAGAGVVNGIVDLLEVCHHGSLVDGVSYQVAWMSGHVLMVPCGWHR